MKAFKKIMSAVIAAATLMTGMSFPVSATTYDCDVNDDGKVNVRDLALIRRYLSGNLYEANYNKFDVNKSLTIDNSDELCISAYMYNESYGSSYYSREIGTGVAYPTAGGFVGNSSETSTSSRTYMRYSYKTKSAKSNYILTPAANTNSASETDAASYTLTDEDSRYLATGPENSGIVRLSTGGTGFVVGDHVIATAAHCVYDRYLISWKTNLSIQTYDDNGNIVSNSYLTPVEAHVPLKYKTNLQTGNGAHPEYDYALITVEEDLSDRVHFSLGTSYNVNNPAYSGMPVYVTGCPGTVNGASNNGNKLYSAEGSIIGYNVNSDDLPFDYEDSILTYDVDASGGDSGAPLYTITQNNIDGTVSYIYTALAFYTYWSPTHNFGAVITKYHLQFFSESINPYITY